METKKNIIILAIIFILIAGSAGWYIYNDLKKPSSLPGNAENNQPADSGDTVNPGLSSNLEKIKKQMPDLDRKIVVKINIPEETKNTAITKIKEIAAELKNDYDSRENWLNLGIWQKTIGDYEGARQTWEFVILIRPNDPVAYHNLGDLYSQFLIDFSKAEKYYLLAIEKEPETSFYYMKLHEFYRYFLKKSDLAESILVKGIKATGDSALKTILESYRKDIGK